MSDSNTLAIIDMGSNTFQLLIVKRANNDLGFELVHRDRHYVLLAEGGIDIISQSSLDRAEKAIDAFKNTLSTYDQIDLVVVGTEALRMASNGDIVNNYVRKNLLIEPKIISGDREAELIYKGNSLVMDPNDVPYLIMDIGGGSTEFVVVTKEGVRFSKSYPLGVTRIYNEFNEGDPISPKAIEEIENYMEVVLSDLTNALNDISLNKLVGASGSFEVVSTVLYQKAPTSSIIDISLVDFDEISNTVIGSTIDQRRNIEGIPESRVKLIQVALVMMRKIISMYQVRQLGVSPFAIKEGIIQEWLQNKKSI